MSKKSWIISGLSFVVLSVGLYLILANSHIAIFPGIEFVYDATTGEEVPQSGLISLLAHVSQFGELNTVGYILAGFVVLVLPAIASYFLGKKLGAK